MGRLALSGWFEIFKTGVWHGIEYGKDNLDEIVKNFEKGDPRVPLIIGHNDFWGGEEKPAMGWVAQLKRVGNKLMAKAEHVSEELVEAVNERVYPMRSIELWGNYHGRGLALGAIAFLGGSNPEVGGMADFKFSKSGSQPGYLVDFKDGERRLLAAPSQTKLVADTDDGQEYTNHHQGGDDMSITKEQMDKAITDAIAQSIEQFRAGPEFTGLKTENERLSAELENAKETTLAIQLRADINDCMGTAKRLLDEKKVTPAVYNAGLGAFLASLDNQDEIELGDKKQTRRAYAISLLESMPAKKGLFTAVDDVQTREGEDVPADIEAFAQKYGIDPKIVLQNYQKLRTGKLTENSTDGE